MIMIGAENGVKSKFKFIKKLINLNELKNKKNNL